MPGWSIWLCDHNGVRLADLSRNQGFSFVRKANSVGSFDVVMGEAFDDALLGKDYRIEIWREFEGNSKLVFAGLVDSWAGIGTEQDQGRRVHVQGKCINQLLNKRVIIPDPEFGPSGVFAGTQSNDTFQLSVDNGANWSNQGTPGMTTQGITDSCLAADGSLIVTVGSNTVNEPGRIYRSTDRGKTYTLVHTNAALTELDVFSVASVPQTGTLIAVTSPAGTFLRSADNGATWAVVDTTGGASRLFQVVVAANGHILAAGQAGIGVDPTVWCSTDDGLNFSNIATLTGSSDYQVRAMHTLRNGDVLLGTGPSWAEVWRSRNNGASWTNTAKLRNLALVGYIYDFVQLLSGIVLAGTSNGAHIFGSSDNGNRWWHIATLVGGGANIYSFMLLNNGEVLAATDSNGRVYRSSNQGRTWALLSTTGENATLALSRVAF